MAKSKKISGVEFARLAGVSRMAISKLASAGKLARDKNKKFDINHPDNKAYLEYHTAGELVARNQTTKEHDKKTSKKKVQKKPGSKNNIKVKTKSNPKPKIKISTRKTKKSTIKDLEKPLEYSETDLSLIADMNLLPRKDLERLKIISNIQKDQVKTQKDREILISRSLVERVFAKLYTVDANQFKNLGMNLAPDIAAITGKDDPETTIKINELIDKELYSILSHIKRIINDFLEEIGSEKN